MCVCTVITISVISLMLHVGFLSAKGKVISCEHRCQREISLVCRFQDNKSCQCFTCLNHCNSIERLGFFSQKWNRFDHNFGRFFCFVQRIVFFLIFEAFVKFDKICVLLLFPLLLLLTVQIVFFVSMIVMMPLTFGVCDNLIISLSFQNNLFHIHFNIVNCSCVAIMLIN